MTITPVFAATVTTFVMVKRGDTLAVTNPQTAAVSGSVRLLTAPGAQAPVTRSFSLLSTAAQNFPDALAGFGGNAPYGILAIDSSDVVRTNMHVLALAHANRPQRYVLNYNATKPETGMLYLALLGKVKVQIYRDNDDQVPFVTKDYDSLGAEALKIVAYKDVLNESVYGGILELVPESGQATAFLVNAPTRQRPSRPRGNPPPSLSVSGGLPCEFRADFAVTTPLVLGASQHWSLYNVSQDGTASNRVGLVLGTAGYATIALRQSLEGNAFAEVNLKIEGKVEVRNLRATDALVGQDVIITWDPLQGSGVLYGDDFPALGTVVNLAFGRYVYTAGSPGDSKQVQLAPDGPCGSVPATDRYTVSEPEPVISSFTTSDDTVAPLGTATLSFAYSGGSSWTISSSRNNGVSPSGGSSTTGGTADYRRDNAAGDDILTLRVCNASNRCTTDTLTVRDPAPTISSFTTSDDTVGFGAGATLSFVYVGGVSWTISSSRGNGITPSGSESTTGGTANYTRDNAAGNDILTLRVCNASNVCVTDALTIRDPPPTIISFTASPTTISFGGTSTLTFMIEHATSWTLSSSIGNGFVQQPPDGTDGIKVTYSAANNTGVDTITLTGVGPGGSTSRTLQITVN